MLMSTRARKSMDSLLQHCDGDALSEGQKRMLRWRDGHGFPRRDSKLYEFLIVEVEKMDSAWRFVSVCSIEQNGKVLTHPDGPSCSFTSETRRHLDLKI